MILDLERLIQERRRLFELGPDANLCPAEFNRLALEGFYYQYERNPAYQLWCRQRGSDPDTMTTWEAIPEVPTDAFKVERLSTEPAESTPRCFHTSGTTRGGVPGRNYLPSLELYEASAGENWRSHVLPEGRRMPMVILGPSSRYFRHSSLGHMLSFVRGRWGSSGGGIFWTHAGLRMESLLGCLAELERDSHPVCILGTCFALVHFLDALKEMEHRFQLAPGSRIMDTGGFKGRSREVGRAELLEMYRDLLGIPPEYVINEYGMTELASQCYASPLRSPNAPTSLKPPPWVKVQLIDPETWAPIPNDSGGSERIGLIRLFDLANLYSVQAIQTDDLGRWTAGGFQVLGRAAGATPRGCSLDAEEFLQLRGRR